MALVALWGASAAAYRKISATLEDVGDKARLDLRLQGIEARPELIKIITGGLKTQGAKSVYIDFAGRTQRAVLGQFFVHGISADETVIAHRFTDACSANLIN